MIFSTKAVSALAFVLTAALTGTDASLRGSNLPNQAKNIAADEITNAQQASYLKKANAGLHSKHHRKEAHTTTDSDRKLKSTANFETKIVGGSNADRGAYPFFVSWDGCGASVIHDDLVLSAAHCDVPGSARTVVIAPYDLNDLDDATERTVVGKVAHPNYDDDAATPAYDFIILKLDQPVEQKPIRLNRSINNPSDGEDITVIGFGATSEGGGGSDILQEVKVQAVPHSTCVSQYGNEIKREIHLCAGVSGGGKDSCQGDSGGPIFEFDNGTPVQVGVVSFGEGCARAGYAGVYARVSGVADWIDQQICALSSVNRPTTCPPTPVPIPTPAPVPTSNDDNAPSPTTFDFPDLAPSEFANGSPSESGNFAPSDFGDFAPADFGDFAPSDFGDFAPSDSGNFEPSDFGDFAPSDSGNFAPSDFGDFAPSDSGNVAPSDFADLAPSDLGELSPTN